MDTDLYAVRDNGTIVLRVHVQPGAGRTAIQGRHGDALKVSVAAPPQGGRANDAVAKLLGEVFGLKKDAVSVVGGATSRSKQFLLAGLDEEAVREALELALDEAARRPGSAGKR